MLNHQSVRVNHTRIKRVTDHLADVEEREDQSKIERVYTSRIINTNSLRPDIQ